MNSLDLLTSVLRGIPPFSLSSLFSFLHYMILKGKDRYTPGIS